MKQEYITGLELAKRMTAANREKALQVRSTLQNARVAQRLEGIASENDYWMKEGFLDGTKDL